MSLSLLLVSLFTIVEFNCENLFDTRHDTLKLDQEFLPTSDYHWTPTRYWRKLSRVGQALAATGEVSGTMLLPDLAVLTEVENDSVMRDLCCRSLLRTAGYRWVMTDSPDERGIDVALLYSPLSFRLLSYSFVRVTPTLGFQPTRDILYAAGMVATGDTLHVVGVHAPSRRNGELASRPYRMAVARAVCQLVDSVTANSRHPLIVVTGDFNDYSESPAILELVKHGLTEVSKDAVGSHGARGSYRYHGEWRSIDHLLCNDALVRRFVSCRIGDAEFLLEKDKKYGVVKPRRTYLGPRYLGGTSDHLPLVTVFDVQ